MLTTSGPTRVGVEDVPMAERLAEKGYARRVLGHDDGSAQFIEVEAPDDAPRRGPKHHSPSGPKVATRLHFTPEQRAILDRESERAGLSLSAYVGMLLEREAGGE